MTDIYRPYERLQDEVIRNTLVVHPDSTLVYIGIPKCASSTLKEKFNILGWQAYKTIGNNYVGKRREEDPDIDISGAEYFAVLRDPVDRWVSGIAQSFYRNKEEVVERIVNDITPFVEDPWYDTHQAPQYKFIEHWDPKLFKIDDMTPLIEWLADKEVYIGDLDVKNASSAFKERNDLRNIVANSLTPEHMDKLYEYYAKDYELYKGAI